MSAGPRVIDTGHTVSLLHRLYDVTFPDGTTEEMFIIECNGDTPEELDGRANRRARQRWQQRRQQITVATGEETR